MHACIKIPKLDALGKLGNFLNSARSLTILKIRSLLLNLLISNWKTCTWVRSRVGFRERVR